LKINSTCSPPSPCWTGLSGIFWRKNNWLGPLSLGCTYKTYVNHIFWRKNKTSNRRRNLAPSVYYFFFFFFFFGTNIQRTEMVHIFLRAYYLMRRWKILLNFEPVNLYILRQEVSTWKAFLSQNIFFEKK